MQQKSHYESGQLHNHLEDLQYQLFSGKVYIDAHLTSSAQPLSRVFIFNKGKIVYGGFGIPNNQELASQIGKKLNHSWTENAIKYLTPKLQNPSSYRELLDNMVRIRVFKWEDIENIVRTQVIQILEQTLPYGGELHLDATLQCDLDYGNDHHGLDLYQLMQEVERRQQEWLLLAPKIPSIEAIPQLSTHGLEGINDKSARQHLLQWVDGQRRLVDIAEQLGEDPLVLARFYRVWVASGWVEFREKTPVDTELPSTEQQRPIVLSVDDSPIVQAMIQRSLSDRYHLLLASNATDALQLINTKTVELLLLDVTMPDIDGLEFCRIVRSIPKFKHLPIIMLTARDKFSDRLRGQIAGATHYLIKPVEPQKLLEMVEKCLEEKKSKLGNSELLQPKVPVLFNH
ncbi:MAG: response regulator [Nostocaceae cyanobacterium]|nr:response regulator [Nostocaceae cyanobacterium]